jgi:hypothetical protein
MLGEESVLSERQRYWLDHVRGCEESGQATKVYAESHGLSTSLLYSWRKRLAERGLWPVRTRRFQRVQISPPATLASEWRITLPNGVQVVFSGPVSGSEVSTVLTAAMGVR